jgi:hypothetical protein
MYSETKEGVRNLERNYKGITFLKFKIPEINGIKTRKS